MTQPRAHPVDPIGWTVALTTLFIVLALVRLPLPSKTMFDEVHYVPAARALLELSHRANPEHPPFGKEMLALGIWLFGDRPFGWRAMPLLFGTMGFYAAMRGMWFASQARFATLATGVLLLTAFPLFLLSRIAMLDVFMVSLTLVGLALAAGAVRENETARWRLPLAGIALGLAMASKWNAIPVAVLPGLAFLAWRAHAAWQARLPLPGWLITTRGAPVRGMSLIEAAVWLGALPIAAYLATYIPLMFTERAPVPWNGLLDLHQKMLGMQHQQLGPHRYSSVWWQWVLDLRAIWFLYENIDGAQRGVMMVGNPATMWLGLPALAWCAWMGLARRRIDALALATLYAVSMALWILASKNVQFYYHYTLSSCFLVGALALALDELWQRGWKKLALLAMVPSLAIFVIFWPVLTADELAGPRSFSNWTWLPVWA